MNLLSSLLKYTADQIAALRAKNTSQDTTVSGINTRLGTAETKVTNMEAQLATAISAVTADSEVQNIRVGDDNVTYATAGEAVRKQFASVKSNMVVDGCPWIKELYINSEGAAAGVAKVNNIAAFSTTDFRLLFANSAGDAFKATTQYYPISNKPTGIIPIYNVTGVSTQGSTIFGYIIADFSFVTQSTPVNKNLSAKAFNLDCSPRINSYLSSVEFDKIQTLSYAQEAQARANIGAISVDDLSQGGAKSTKVDSNSDFINADQAYNADGTIGTFVGWNTTDFIKCHSWDRIAYELVGFNRSNLNVQLATIAFFDDNLDFVSSIALQTQSSGEIMTGEADIPASAWYFKALGYASIQPNPKVTLLKIGTLEKAIEDCVNKYDVRSRLVGEKHITATDFSICTTSIKLYNPLFTNGFVAPCDGLLLGVRTLSSVTKIGVYVAKGLYSQSKEWRCFAENIPVVTSKVVEETVDNVTAWVSSYNLEMKQGDEVYVRFMDGTFMYGGSGNSYNALATLDAASVMVVDYTVAFNLLYAELETDIDPHSEVKNLTICAIGDSLTQGVDIYKHVYAESYPYWLSRYLGSKVLNYGQMGRTAQTWWNNYKTYYSYDSSIDVVLIMFGTNGGLSTNTLATDVEPYNDWNDYADSNCGDYCKLIEYIMEQTNNHAQIFLIVPPHSTYTTAQDNAVIASEAVIRAIAKRYSLPVIDVLNECGMGKFNGAMFRPNDGCHFNAKGYHKLGTFIGNRVKSYLSQFELTDVYDDEYIGS